MFDRGLRWKIESVDLFRFKVNIELNLICIGLQYKTFSIKNKTARCRIKPIVTKIRNIQNSFQHGCDLKIELKRVQNEMSLTEVMMLFYSEAKWWSLLELFQFVIRQNEALEIVFSRKPNINDYVFTNQDLQLLRLLPAFVTPFKEACEELCKENYAFHIIFPFE